MTRIAQSLLLAVVAIFSADAFAPVTFSSRTATPMSMAVVDIDGEAAFDKTIKSAGSSLVVVDYSTTWCGPCKVIAPKFDELSEKYADLGNDGEALATSSGAPSSEHTLSATVGDADVKKNSRTGILLMFLFVFLLGSTVAALRISELRTDDGFGGSWSKFCADPTTTNFRHVVSLSCNHMYRDDI